ncbi:MAG: AbrB/MazE/SpoVT family DNA-binding domain-containing protein [Tepidiformaceae bacterium]
MRKSHITRVGKRNTVTIPVEMLRRRGWKPGDQIVVSDEEGEPLTIETNEAAVDRVYGMLKRPGQPSLTDEELEEAIRTASEEAAAARYLRSQQ